MPTYRREKEKTEVLRLPADFIDALCRANKASNLTVTVSKQGTVQAYLWQLATYCCSGNDRDAVTLAVVYNFRKQAIRTSIIESVTPENILSNLAALSPALKGDEIPLFAFQAGLLSRENGLFINNQSTLPIYGTDFGSGAPIWFDDLGNGPLSAVLDERHQDNR